MRGASVASTESLTTLCAPLGLSPRPICAKASAPPACASALYDSPLPLAYAAFACDLHSDLQNNRTLQDNALTLLVNEIAS